MKFVLVLLISLFPVPVHEEYSEGSFICPGIEGSVSFVLDKDIPSEGYSIEVTPSGAEARYSDAGGLFYAHRALECLSTEVDDGLVGIPCCSILDYPRAAWRGFMLDSGRQYQSPRTIMRLLDMMADLKMNVFHWHLTEGLGWRLPVRRYPKLARKGAFVADGPEQQGYYTRKEIRQIVSYAAARNITVVPEVDIPGHAEAALRVYPEYSCFGEPAEIPESGFTQTIFCAGKRRTIRFLKNVLNELCRLFPSEYIHLGGDEAPKGNWDRCPDCARRMQEEGLKDSAELQLWLSAQMAAHLEKKGRKAIFWEDVLYKADYPLPDNVAIQWWNYRGHGASALSKAMEKGCKVICSPNYYTYLNFPTQPWMGYEEDRTFSLDDAYLRNPVEEGLSIESPSVLGAECALWTDYGLTEDILDERLFPRIYALSQLFWSGNSVQLLPAEVAD